MSGVTKLRNILALKDIAYSNVADLKSDWDEFKEWGDLTAAEKASISEITHTETTVGEDMTVKVVKVKTHDKTKAIAILNKMLGFDMTATTDALKDFIFEVTQTYKRYNKRKSDNKKKGNKSSSKNHRSSCKVTKKGITQR